MADPRTDFSGFEVVVSPRADHTEVRLRGELDLASAPRLAESLTKACARGLGVVVDVSDLSYCDSSGIRELLEGAARCKEHDARLTVTGASDSVRRVLDVTGVAGALGLADGADDLR